MEALFGIDLPSLIETIGLIGIFFIVFAESGLLVGFFLPGDSLLFTAGFLASQDYLPIGTLVVGCFIAAILGDNFGYAFGWRLGPKIFRRERSRLFNPKNLEYARRFYERHGGKTIVLARFMPFIRTFAPILAGVGEMHYRTFLVYNATGAVLWAVGLTAAGYTLGNAIPNPDRYLVPIILAIVIVSVLPGVIRLYSEYRRHRR